jgi:hypothetical protein
VETCRQVPTSGQLLIDFFGRLAGFFPWVHSMRRNWCNATRTDECPRLFDPQAMTSGTVWRDGLGRRDEAA